MGNTGSEEARVTAAETGGYPVEFDVPTYFLHDVPAEVLASEGAEQRPEAAIAFSQPCDIESWPTSPPGSWPVATTASSRCRSKPRWPGTASGPRSTQSPAAISMHFPDRSSWLTASATMSGITLGQVNADNRRWSGTRVGRARAPQVCP